MQGIQIVIGNSMPVQLVCLEDGSIMFVKVADFPGVLESPVEGVVTADFFRNNFYLSSSKLDTDVYTYSTRYRYKEHPKMLAWLQRQNLVSPF